jgi:D-alanine-D-alanine ligase
VVVKALDGCISVNCAGRGGGGHPPQPSVCEQPTRLEAFLSFSDKYLRGSEGAKSSGGMASLDRRIPAPISEALTKQVQDNALRAFKAIDASGVARVDAFVDEDSGQTWVMEINTVPGSFSFYLWEPSGVPFPDLMDALLDIAAREHALRSELMVSFDSGLLAGLGGPKAGG